MVVLDPLAGWLTLAGIVLAIGVVATRWILLPNATIGDAQRELAAAAVAAIGRLAGIGALAGLLLVLARQTIEFRDPFVPLSEDLGLLLLGTDWGHAWIGALAAALVLTVSCALAARGGVAGWWVATAAALALAYFPGLTGHAAAARPEHPLALAADALHVLAAGCWVGGLAVMLLLARAPGRSRTSPVGMRDLLPVFSPLALVAAATIAGTGLYAAWVHLGALDALVASTYGRTMLAKLGLVALAMLAGALNWRRHGPALLREGDAGPLRRTAVVELLIFQAVLLATAFLVRTAPSP